MSRYIVWITRCGFFVWLEIQRETGRVHYNIELCHPLNYMKFKSSASISTSVYEFKNEICYLVTADVSLKKSEVISFWPGFSRANGGSSLKSAGKICMLCTFSSESTHRYPPSEWSSAWSQDVDWQSVSALRHVISVLKLRLNLFKGKLCNQLPVTLQVMMTPKPTQCILNK